MYKIISLSIGLLLFAVACKKELTEAEKAKMKQDSIAAREKTYDFSPDKAIGLGRIEPEQKIIKLYPETSGTVQQLLIKAGMQVKAGELICVLSHEVEDAKIKKIEAQIAAQEVQVKTQDTQVRAQDEQVNAQETQVQSQEAQIAAQAAQVDAQDVQTQTQQTLIRNFDKDIAKAQLAVDLAQKNFNRTQSLYQKGAETRVNFESSENQLNVAKAEVERLQSQKVNLQAQIDNIKAQQKVAQAQTEIARAQKRNLSAQKNNYLALKDNAAAQKNNLAAKIAELKADLEVAKAERAKKNIYALSDGKMLSVDIVIGSYLASNTSIGDFAPDAPTVVVAEIDELFAGKVDVGQKAAVRLQGSSKEVAVGKVTEVSPYLRQKSLFSDELGKLEDRRVREIKVRLENPPKELLYGTRVDCVVYLK